MHLGAWVCWTGIVQSSSGLYDILRGVNKSHTASSSPDRENIRVAYAPLQVEISDNELGTSTSP